MRVLFFGAGPLGMLYGHYFQRAGVDVTLLARGGRYEDLKNNTVTFHNEMTGSNENSSFKVIDSLSPDMDFDLAVVLVRNNLLPQVLSTLAPCNQIHTILFMGNNALGFDRHLQALPAHKLLFGFPGAGGGYSDHQVRYADRETPGGKTRPVMLGLAAGGSREKLTQVKTLFESAGLSVQTSENIDGWLRYHVALISPFVGALYKHNCDNYLAAKDGETLRMLVKAANEGAKVLKALGYGASEPTEFKLMRWLPLFMSVAALRKMLSSRFAEIAFSLHAAAARDEMLALTQDFESLINQSRIETPNIAALGEYTREFGN